MQLRLITLAAFVMGAVVAVAFATVARAQGSTIAPDRLRFRVVVDEPIANADLRGTVPGWRVLVVKDTRTDQCYATFVSTAMISKTDAIGCP